MAKKPALINVIIDALEDIKAKDIKLINVAKITSVSDYIAVASADSTRQTRALANNVIDKVKEAGYSIYGSEGGETGEWVLVDCGDVVVHIMQPAVRAYYNLEELWRDGKVEFPRPTPAPKPVKTAKTTKVEVEKPVVKKVAKKVAKKAAKKVPPKSAAKPAAKKPRAASTTAKKPVAASATAKKPAAASTTAKKLAAKKVAAKKPAAKKATVKKSSA